MLPKKGIRKITVNNDVFGWSAKFNDDDVGISIQIFNREGQLLTGRLGYQYNKVLNVRSLEKTRNWFLWNRTKITPKTIRLIIELGIEQGWQPKENLGEFNLGKLDEKIDTYTRKGSIFPKLGELEVAIMFVENKTGHVLQSNKELYIGEGNVYQVCPTYEEAKNIARETVRTNPEIECWIMSEENKIEFSIIQCFENEYLTKNA